MRAYSQDLRERGYVAVVESSDGSLNPLTRLCLELFPCRGRGNPPLSGLGIESRLVVRVLVFEGVMGIALQTRIGLGTQELLQYCSGTSVLREAPQPQ